MNSTGSGLLRGVKMGPICSPETLVLNHFTPRNNPEDNNLIKPLLQETGAVPEILPLLVSETNVLNQRPVKLFEQ
jgi:hypothetical protein